MSVLSNLSRQPLQYARSSPCNCSHVSNVTPSPVACGRLYLLRIMCCWGYMLDILLKRVPCWQQAAALQARWTPLRTSLAHHPRVLAVPKRPPQSSVAPHTLLPAAHHVLLGLYAGHRAEAEESPCVGQNG
jgi:hypothetical protein